MPPTSALHSSDSSPSDRFVCSWCGDRIGRATRPHPKAENFGICRGCLDEELARLEARKPARSDGGSRRRTAALRAAR